MTPDDVTPAPSAYPDPIHLPVAPRGDPLAARLLAGSYLGLADRLDHAACQVAAINADLARRWHGYGATALRVPTETMADNLRTLARSYRDAADHLNDYADALHHAQHHHGWSLGKIIAIGAVVTVTAVAVVVTVGAAAPVGTLAASEVGEAILGAEAAAAGATAAETTTTAGLSLSAQAMTGLRTLSALALPHLAQGAASSGIDSVLHLATGRRITDHELELSFLGGTLGSATTTATRSALRASEGYQGATAGGRAALDTTALTATLTADSALQEYAATGHLSPTALTEGAVLTALTGGAATLRRPFDGTLSIARRVPKGQPLEELSTKPDLRLHQGPEAPYGHTLSKHVDRDEVWLRQRLIDEPWIDNASSFRSRADAEEAVVAAIRRNPGEVALLVSGQKRRAELRFTLPHQAGVVVPRGEEARSSDHGWLFLKLVNGNVVVVTAFLE